MNFITNKTFLILLLLIIPFLGPLHASETNTPEQKEFVFNNNSDLQKYLETSFDLEFQEKNFTFKPKDFSTWKVSFTLQEDYSSEIERDTLCQADSMVNVPSSDLLMEKFLSICTITNATKSIGHFKKGAVLKIDEKKIDEFILKLSEEIISAPKNAKVKMEFTEKTDTINTPDEIKINTKEIGDGKPTSPEGKLLIISPAKSGFSLEEEKTREIILLALGNPEENKVFQLPTKEEKPKISKETLDELKISEQIGHGESNFAGSPKNRVFNINLATDKFNGVLIGPGEEFSFVNTLGPVEKETGYKEELVIKDNKTIPEYGGGVCQVSTTVFRAVLNTGLKITERQNHSYPVQYYSPQGTDSTIYLPSPDLKFINNTPNFILFQAAIEGSKLIFDVFGESDGRTVTLEGPKVMEKTPEGILKVKLKQIVTDKDGKLVFEDTFNSVYDNPDKYHETEILRTKPDNWSNLQWSEYKKAHNL
jgi:vancomycin resistance protein YoaR